MSALIWPGQFRDLLRGLRFGVSEFLKATGEVRDEFDQRAGDAGRSLGGIYGKPAAEALTTDNRTVEFRDPKVLRGWEKTEGNGKRRVKRPWGRFRRALNWWRLFRF